MPLPIQNFGHILTDLVDAVLVGDELALDVLRLQRAAQQGGYPADRADRLPDSCWHAGKRRSSAILADSYAALLYLPLLLCKRIFCGIRQALGLVVGNVRNAEELEHFKQRLAIVTEGNGTSREWRRWRCRRKTALQRVKFHPERCRRAAGLRCRTANGRT